MTPNNAGHLQRMPLRQLKGVGPALAEKLGRLGLATVQDLLFLLPRQYEDRTRITPFGSLIPGMTTLAEGEVKLADIVNGRRRSLLVRLRDNTGGLTLRFYHFRQSQKDSYSPGLRLRVFGEVRLGALGPEMIHPEVERIDDTLHADDHSSLTQHLDSADLASTYLTPIYPLVEGLSQRRLRELIARALPLLDIPDALIERLPSTHSGGWNVARALRCIHAPSATENRQQLTNGEHPAQQYLAFEELLAHQISLLHRRQGQRQLPAPVLPPEVQLSANFRARLPFQLTPAQVRVLGEIGTDLASTTPMLRLVQGDVGAGKTVVAALAACPALAAGWQVVIMAPTEILAEQHRVRFSAWFTPLGITVGWLAGKLIGKARERQLEALANGSCQLLVGTHAVFQDHVAFHRLGLVVIDEQHRFGVEQRLALARKGQDSGWQAHQLIMTATPIPRTLAMSAYGDLDNSIIDSLPPGRQPIQTIVLPASRRDDLIARIRHQVSSGQQVYWVCTLIETSEQIQAQAAQDTWQTLSEALPELAIGLVHGQLKGPEKAAVMTEFAAGRLSVLVATTVIEVGVDVPNASLMVIENPERLGLSQLHQLRGRVGRGEHASFCVLLYQSPLSHLGRQRLQILRDSQDGFVIAQRDLELRGPGEVLGTRQTGDVNFRIADLIRDQHLLPVARELAYELLAGTPGQTDYLLERWLGRREHYAQV